MLAQVKTGEREELPLKKVEEDGRDVRGFAVFIHRSDFPCEEEFESSRK